MAKETIIIADVARELDALRLKVEQQLGHSVELPRDFDELTQQVVECTGMSISVNTLKRLYGYVSGYNTCRRFTLNVLSRYVGYRDWDGFCANIKANAASQIFIADVIDSDTLRPGQRLALSWHPDRRVVIVYCGNNEYRVMESENAKLMAGDSFRCQSFVKGQHLIISNLLHKGMNHPINYICGKQGGINVELL